VVLWLDILVLLLARVWVVQQVILGRNLRHAAWLNLDIKHHAQCQKIFDQTTWPLSTKTP
jgi:hypothetical protein